MFLQNINMLPRALPRSLPLIFPIFPYFPYSNTLIFQYSYISHIPHIFSTCTALESPTRISQEKDQQGSPRAPTLNKNTIQVHFAKYTQEKYTQENTLWKLKSWEKKLYIHNLCSGQCTPSKVYNL